MPDDKSLRVSVEVHTELTALADDHKENIGNFADALLEYVMCSRERVEEAVTFRREQGFKKTRDRRGGDGTWKPA